MIENLNFENKNGIFKRMQKIVYVCNKNFFYFFGVEIYVKG